jgi:hypothetical protein
MPDNVMPKESKEPVKLTCRCSAPNKPISCKGGCEYLCKRLQEASHA